MDDDTRLGQRPHTKSKCKITPLMMANPIGWTHNPSSVRARMPVVLFSSAGLLCTSLLPDSLGAIPRLWSLNFLVVLILASLGGSRRWARTPWLVTLMGVFVAPVALTCAFSSALRMALTREPSLMTYLAIVLAAFSVGPAADELLASWQNVKLQGRRGRSPLRAFFGLSARHRKRGHVEGIDGLTEFHPIKG